MKGNQGFNTEFIRFEILVKYEKEITGRHLKIED